VQTAALGTALVFATSGVAQATWLSRLPALAARTQAEAPEIGLALAAGGCGLLVSMVPAGLLCKRLGSRRVLPATVAATCLVVAALSWATDLTTLIVLLFLYGLAAGAWDVAMNVHASATDRLSAGARMPFFHGVWSLGVGVGATVGGLAAFGSAPLWAHLVAAAGFCGVVAGAGVALFLDDRTAPVVGGSVPSRRRRIPLIALFILSAATVEGSAGDWLTLLLTGELAASHTVAAVIYAGFAFSMAAGRFGATVLLTRVRRVSAVRLGALLTAAGVVATVLFRSVPMAWAGVILWGLGVSIAFPAAVSASGETSRPAVAIAFTTTIGYAASLIGPIVVGQLAADVGLGFALLVLLPLLGLTVLLAPAVSGPAARRQAA
jgi:fucose permease